MSDLERDEDLNEELEDALNQPDDDQDDDIEEEDGEELPPAAEKEDEPERSGELEAREAKLNEREEKLQFAARVANLLEYPEFRDSVLKAIGLAKDGEIDMNSPDGKEAMKIFDRFKDERVDELKAEVESMRDLRRQLEEDYARRDLNSMRDSFKSEYGDDLVTNKVWKEIEQEAVKIHGTQTTYDHIKAVAHERIAKALKNGNGRVSLPLTGKSSKPQAPRGKRGPATDDEVRDVLAKVIYK
jgi:hypothetical protein